MFNSSLTVCGNVVDEPELRFTKSSRAVAQLTVAVDRGRKVNGQWQTETAFIQVTAWEKLAENAAESFAKGQRIIATGTLKQDNWEDPDGSKRSKLCMVAEDLAASVKWGPLGNSSPTRKSKPVHSADEEPF